MIRAERATSGGGRRRVESGVGWRRHVLSVTCWCRPYLVQDDQGQMMMHRTAMLRPDSVQRMTVFSSR